MLRFHVETFSITKGQPKPTKDSYVPFGRFTVRPKAGSKELKEAHRQTANGQRKALGLMMLLLPEEETDRPEYQEGD